MADPDDVLRKKLEEVRGKFLAELPGRLEKLQGAWATYMKREDQKQSIAMCIEQAHRLAGAGTTFGCPEVSARAAEVERAFEELNGGTFRSKDMKRVSELLQGLGQAAVKAQAERR